MNSQSVEVLLPVIILKHNRSWLFLVPVLLVLCITCEAVMKGVTVAIISVAHKFFITVGAIICPQGGQCCQLCTAAPSHFTSYIDDHCQIARFIYRLQEILRISLTILPSSPYIYFSRTFYMPHGIEGSMVLKIKLSWKSQEINDTGRIFFNVGPKRCFG